MKRVSSWNTVVGAVSGALPPLVGWAGAFGDAPGDGISFRTEIVFCPESFFLFTLLFFWQLPHFVAINWIYREQYRDGGFIMWSNDDENGARTSLYAILFTVPLVVLMAQPLIYGFGGWILLGGGMLCSLWMLVLAVRFRRSRSKADARKLFLFTLAYLPLVLALLVIDWRQP
jgi:heme O synthase-like polyprenyltransferase